MKNILVTGGCGFIGSHLTLFLRKKNFKIIVIDNLKIGKKNLFRGHKFYKINLENKKKLEEVFKLNKIDCVVHLAGLSKLTESFKKKKLYEKNNIISTENLIRFTKKYKIKHFIFSSSASVYGKAKKFPITEDSKLKPISYYGQTKLTSEKIIQKFSSKKSFNSICLRFFNVVGSNYANKLGEIHKPPIHLIPILINQIIKKKPISIRFGFKTNDFTGERDYVDVLDIVNAHYLCIKKIKRLTKSFETINLGSKKIYSTLDIFKILEKSFYKEKIRISKLTKLRGEPDKLLASNYKASKILGWKPKVKIKDSIKNMIKWEKYLIKKRMKSYSQA